MKYKYMKTPATVMAAGVFKEDRNLFKLIMYVP